MLFIEGDEEEVFSPFILETFFYEGLSYETNEDNLSEWLASSATVNFRYSSNLILNLNIASLCVEFLSLRFCHFLSTNLVPIIKCS